jgi:diguanylate cyclase (GGDEF)-like protein
MSRSALSSGAASRRLAWFLLGFRWLTLLLGLTLGWMHSSNPKVAAAAYPDLGILPLAGIGFYHLIASVVSLKARDSKTIAGVVVTGDLIAGCLLIFTSGADYFLLGFVLPILESAHYLSSLVTMFLGILFGCFQLPLVAKQIFTITPVDSGLAAVHTQGVLAGLAVCLAMWNLVSLFHGFQDEGEKLVKQHHEEKNLLFEQLHMTKKEIGSLFNQLDTRDDSTRHLEAELKDVREDLEATLAKLQEYKQAVQSTQQLAQRKESELTASEEKIRTEASQRLQAAANELKQKDLVLELVSKLNQSLHRDQLVMALIDCLNTLLPSQTCLVFALEVQDGREELLPDGGASPYLDFVRDYSIAPGEGAVGWVAVEQQVLLIENEQIAGNDELSTLFSNEKAAMIAPLTSQERTLGVLYLGRPAAGAYSAADLAVLERFARLASPIFNNALLYHRVLTTGLYDEVTNLYNAAYFDERLTEEVRRANRYKRALCLILIDLDNFTRFNDQAGHAEGNRVLKDVAGLLREQTRETDVVARLENDAFAVLLVESDKNNAVLIGERIRSAFELRYMAQRNRNRPAISISGGLACFPSECKSRDQLVEKASQALASAQEKTGNQIAY